MSRTDKDRPDWVQQNDFTLDMEYYHDHISFGRLSGWRWSGGFAAGYVHRTYMDYCTLLEVRPNRPLYNCNDIYEYEVDGKRQFFILPCGRWVRRRVQRRYTCAPHYHKHVMRPKERDFLKAEVKRYNSGYTDGDEYFMDEEVFTTRHYGVNGVGL